MEARFFHVLAGSIACQNSAIFTWSFGYQNGTLQVQWGTNNQYGNSKSLYPYQARTVTVDTISPLQPDTKYYYRMYGTWNNKTYVLVDSSFTTTTAAKVRMHTSPRERKKYAAGGNALFTPLGERVSAQRGKMKSGVYIAVPRDGKSHAAMVIFDK